MDPFGVESITALGQTHILALTHLRFAAEIAPDGGAKKGHRKEKTKRTLGHDLTAALEGTRGIETSRLAQEPCSR